MSAREPCVVPGCRNSSGKFVGSGYICSRHWPAVPRALRRLRRQLERKYEGRGEIVDQGSRWDCRTMRSWRALRGCWRRMERAAILAAAGL